MSRVLHCWADRFSVETENEPAGTDKWVEAYLRPSATCMLAAHGPETLHEWTDDDQIRVAFAPFPESAQ